MNNSVNPKCTNDLRLGHINIYHLVNKTHDVALLLNNNQFLHLFGVTETRLKHYHANETVSIPNYNFIRRDIACSGHTGIGVYVHDSITHHVKRRSNLEPPEIECIWLEVRLHSTCPYLVCFLYRNPTESQEWSDNFVKMMDMANVLNLNMVVLGDFNINLKHSQPLWKTITCTLGLTQLITQPTRITKTSATLIDHIYTNNPGKIYNIRVDPTCISDHNPILCNLSCRSPKGTQKSHTYIQHRSFKHFDKEHFLYDLSKTNFDNVTNFSDPDEATTAFLTTLLPVIDKHAPIRRKRVKHPTLPNWMTPDIMSAMKKRDQLKKDKQFDAYKQQRNRVTTMVRSAKKAYFTKLINEDKTTPQLWRAMNEITNKGRRKHNTRNTFTADEHNKFFLSLVDTIIPPDNRPSPFTSSPSATKIKEYCDSKIKNSNAFHIPPMTVYDVGKHVLHLKNKRSMDSHNLNSSILKMSLPYIGDCLTYIYNLCLAKNIFPAAFKMAKVIPLPKCKETGSIENHRPISILSVLSKPLERHIHNHLLQYMEKHQLFYEHQSGFRPKHSCHTALTRLCNTWLDALNKQNIVGAVFLDLRKAFDLVDHAILIQKLQLYLGNSITVPFFTSYLSSRTQAVYCNGTLSTAEKLKCGVPQGSILGPILFCMYINDLPLHLKHGNVDLDLFADDGSLHCHDKDVQAIQTCLQDSINTVDDWCRINRMALHPKKTKSMIIATRQKHQIQPLQLNLSLNSTYIEQVREHKVLGIIIDEKLSWSSQVESLCKRLSQNIFLLSKLRLYVDRDALKLFFFAHCLSHINYASTIWCNAADTHIKQLNSLHKRAVKIIRYMPEESTLEKYKQLQILPLQLQFQYNACIFMYKLHAEEVPTYLQTFFNKAPDRYGSTKYIVPLPRIDLYKTNLSFWGPSVWNSLPESCRIACSLKEFKRLTRQYLNATSNTHV